MVVSDMCSLKALAGFWGFIPLHACIYYWVYHRYSTLLFDFLFATIPRSTRICPKIVQLSTTYLWSKLRKRCLASVLLQTASLLLGDNWYILALIDLASLWIV